MVEVMVGVAAGNHQWDDAMAVVMNDSRRRRSMG